MDLSSIRSLAYPYHIRTTLATDATGTGALLFLPNYTYLPQNVGAFAGAGIYNFPAAMTAGPSLTASAYRITGMGIIIRSTVAPLSASGMVRVRGYNTKFGTSLTTVDVNTYNCDFYEDQPVFACKETAILAKRTDNSSEFWRAPSETTSGTGINTWISPGWGAIVVAVDGCSATTTILDVEIIVHFEIQLADSDTTAQLATAPPPYVPVVKQATDMVSSTAQNVFTAGLRSVGAYIERKASSALKSLLYNNPRTAPAVMAYDALMVD